MQSQVALSGWVPQMHCLWVLQMQSQVCVLKKCRAEAQAAAGFGTQAQTEVLKTNPHPHCCVEGHRHWHALVS